MRYSYVPMPLTEEGDGPASLVETVRIDHQIWDMTDNSTVCVCPTEEMADRLVKMLNVVDLVEFYFEPWGAYKAAHWEEITNDRGPMKAEEFLHYLKDKLT